MAQTSNVEYDYRDEGDSKYERQNGNGQQPSQRRIIVEAFDEIDISDAPTYLVKGILPDSGLAVIFGRDKSGKSFWFFDLCMHIALGWEYRGRKVKQGVVVYVALEGGRGFRRRVVAWRKKLADDHDPVPFYLISMSFDPITGYRALIDAIRAKLGDDVEPAIIVIDTLNRAMGGRDENDSKDMGIFIRMMDALRTRFGNCLVATIHHCPVVGGRPRGHSSLGGADDVQIAVEKNDDTGIITVKVVHMKDDEAGAVLACKLKQVEVGTDSDGSPITSCVVEPVEAETATGPPADLTGNELALWALRRLTASAIDSIAAPPEAELPEGTRLVRTERWREQYSQVRAGDKPATVRQGWKRAINDLTVKTGAVDVFREYVFITPKADESRDVT